jgi:hypothetical protein
MEMLWLIIEREFAKVCLEGIWQRRRMGLSEALVDGGWQY